MNDHPARTTQNLTAPGSSPRGQDAGVSVELFVAPSVYEPAGEFCACDPAVNATRCGACQISLFITGFPCLFGYGRVIVVTGLSINCPLAVSATRTRNFIDCPAPTTPNGRGQLAAGIPNAVQLPADA